MYYHRGIKKEQSVIAVQSGFSQNIRLKNVPTIKVTYVTKTRELLGVCPIAYWRFQYSLVITDIHVTIFQSLLKSVAPQIFRI